MEIVLERNLVRVRSDFETIASSWMQAYIHLHVKDALFLPSAMMIFSHNKYAKERELFMRQLCSYYAMTHEYSESFYLKSILKYSNKPIKIELNSPCERECVGIELYAYDAATVEMSLYAPNAFVMAYLSAQLDGYVDAVSESNIVVTLGDEKAKVRFERLMNKRHILHFQLQYQYDSLFMQRVYNEYFDEAFEDEEIDTMMQHYTILECHIGASQDALKQSYKKLARVYHPDRVHCENREIVHRYTQKFQLLQEAYTALRIVS